MRANYVLLPVGTLHAHEEVDAKDVAELAELLREVGVLSEPIWVAEGYDVILNGHHRYAAMERLGAEFVPAWTFDYFDDDVKLGRWNSGPVVSKSEVIRRARAGELFPAKTTRHTLTFDLPPRPTPLADLFKGPAHPGLRRPSRGGARSSRGA